VLVVLGKAAKATTDRWRDSKLARRNWYLYFCFYRTAQFHFTFNLLLLLQTARKSLSTLKVPLIISSPNQQGAKPGHGVFFLVHPCPPLRVDSQKPMYHQFKFKTRLNLTLLLPPTSIASTTT
jgi:hypothetical protein